MVYRSERKSRGRTRGHATQCLRSDLKKVGAIALAADGVETMVIPREERW